MTAGQFAIAARPAGGLAGRRAHRRSSATSRSSRRPARATTPTSSRPPPASPALAPRPGRRARGHRRRLDPPPDAQRARRRRLPHLLQADARRCAPRTTAWRWSRRWPTGLIDVVGSFHTPQDEEEKRLPFEEAASGAVGLETLLPAAMQLVHAGHLTLPALWRALALNPARLLGLAAGRLAAGRPGRPRALRPRHALRARPRHAALEVEEHALRPAPDAGPGARAPGSAAREVFAREAA